MRKRFRPLAETGAVRKETFTIPFRIPRTKNEGRSAQQSRIIGGAIPSPGLYPFAIMNTGVRMCH